ncbi:hypothetical protein MLD38_015736 [Melastoma candidum]|uniref:Uncharacterized protein n=1 Tax=Melastoma candidum TaxID=119954 RepID=A0ACB9RIG6_9MYRT|nr:hypothetical protein MLD38_015736 [Melastoma candidum]
MLHELNIDESEVPRMCLELYREHGTTMAGLKVQENSEKHNLQRICCLVSTPDPVLRNLLLSMLQRKIFTNSDKEHAAQLLHKNNPLTQRQQKCLSQEESSVNQL